MKKTYDEILDEVAKEQGINKIEYYSMLSYHTKLQLSKLFRESAERYRAQVDLPSDKDLHKMTDSKYEPLSYLAAGYFNGLRDMRDLIKSQLNERK